MFHQEKPSAVVANPIVMCTAGSCSLSLKILKGLPSLSGSNKSARIYIHAPLKHLSNLKHAFDRH